MTDDPQHHCAVDLVESVSCIDQEEAPLFFHLVGLPNLLHGMDSTFNSSLQAGTQLVSAAGFLRFLFCDKQDDLGYETTPYFSDANGTDAGHLVECNQPTAHECTVA